MLAFLTLINVKDPAWKVPQSQEAETVTAINPRSRYHISCSYEVTNWNQTSRRQFSDNSGFLMFHWIPRFPRWQRRRAKANASPSGRVLPVLQASSAPPPVSSSSLACPDSFRRLLPHPRLRLFPGNHGKRRRSPHLEGEGALDVIFFFVFQPQ